VLSRNRAMLHVFEHSGLAMQVQPEEDGVVRLSLALAPATQPAASR
jgi:hypothetical protein